LISIKVVILLHA
jgi:hypothetical protein